MMTSYAYLVTCDYCSHHYIKLSKPKGIRTLAPTLCPNCGQVGGTCEKYEVIE